MFSLAFNIEEIEFDNFSENFKKIQNELESNLNSETASIPKEEISSYNSEILDALTKVNNSKSLLERIDFYRQVKNLSQEFCDRYREFISSELVQAFETTEKKAEAQKEILQGLSNLQSGENIEIVYQGVLKILETIEHKKNYIYPRIYKSLKEGFNFSLIELEKIKFQFIREKKNLSQKIDYIRAISIASKAILWEINEYERSIELQTSDTVAENANCSNNNKKKETIDWQEEEKFIDDLIAMREEWYQEEYTPEEEEALERVMARLNQE